MPRKEDQRRPPGAAPIGGVPAKLRLAVDRHKASEGSCGERVAAGDRWETLATFVIEIQRAADAQPDPHRSLAHHMESSESREWSGIVTEGLVRWMLSRLLDMDEPKSTGQNPDA